MRTQTHSLKQGWVPSLSARLLEGLCAEERKAILAAATARDYSSDSVIVHQGDRALHLFLLVKGHGRYFFNTESGRKIVLRWLSANEITGGAALLPKASRYIVSTEVVRGTRVLIWDRATLQVLVSRFPKLQQNALYIASEYFEWYLTAHIALTCHSARERCASVLRTIAQTIGQKTSAGIELHISNEDLANTAAITLFNTSRLMSEWQRKGVLVKQRGKVILRSLNFA